MSIKPSAPVPVPALTSGMSAREEAKARVRAKVEAERALPASERVANILHATHTTADAQALLDAIRAEALAEGLTSAERTFLTFALNLAADVMASRSNEFDDEDEAALASLRRLAAAEQAEEKATPTTGTTATPQPAELIVYRASHDSIVMGRYTTREAAREHCETVLRREWPTGTNLTFAWVPDDSDPLSPEELSVFAGQNEESVTGYIVTPLEVASEYDEEADE